MTLEEFEEYYREHQRFPLGIASGKGSYNKKELKTKYGKYTRLLSKTTKIPKKTNKAFVIDEEWARLKGFVERRDKNECQLYKVLSTEEKDIIFNDLRGPMMRLDGAHILSRARRPDLKYDNNNVILLSRLFHSRLDSFHDPVTSKPITEEQRVGWWKRIVGEEYYNNLESK